MSPMGTKFPGRDGGLTPRLLAHYRERAQGGVGLVICEFTFVDKEASRYGIAQLGAFDDDCIPVLERLADTIRGAGARVGLQLGHAGRQRKYGPPVVAPSVVPWSGFGKAGIVVPRELNEVEIQDIVSDFGRAARRVQAAGFDLVELHGGHGYLITQFLSQRTNKRRDRYGGDLDARMRFLREVVTEVRKAVGPAFPVSVRLSQSEYVDGGLDLDDSCKIATMLEGEGVDAIHVSAGTHDSTQWQIAPLYHERAINVAAARTIKNVVDIPVLVVGSITTPEQAEDILASSQADFVTFGRALLADAHLVRKALEGRSAEIRPCLRTNDGCLERPRTNLSGIQCSVNFSVGRQEEYGEVLEPSPRPGCIVVVGGGPGGLEAARVAALRAHEVVLFEERDQLGGWLLEAGVLDRKRDIRMYRNYLMDEIARLKVRVVHARADSDAVADAEPDLVVVATGSQPGRPTTPGSDRADVLLSTSVLAGEATGARAVVVGHDQISIDTALLLIDRNVDVSLVHEAGELAGELDLGSRRVLSDLLKVSGVRVYALSDVRVAPKSSVVAGYDRDGKLVEIEADSVIVTPPLEPVTDLIVPLAQRGLALVAIGDCLRPRRILDAIHEGHIAARSM